MHACVHCDVCMYLFCMYVCMYVSCMNEWMDGCVDMPTYVCVCMVPCRRVDSPTPMVWSPSRGQPCLQDPPRRQQERMLWDQHTYGRSMILVILKLQTTFGQPEATMKMMPGGSNCTRPPDPPDSHAAAPRLSKTLQHRHVEAGSGASTPMVEA